MFEPINGLLKRKRLISPGILLSTQVCYQAYEEIKDIVPNSKEKVKIISFKDNRLKIASDDPIILHKIKMNEDKIKKNIIKKININKFTISYSPKNEAPQ